jgi:hypothetical protein
MSIKPSVWKPLQFLLLALLAAAMYVAFRAYVGPNAVLDFANRLFLC